MGYTGEYSGERDTILQLLKAFSFTFYYH